MNTETKISNNIYCVNCNAIIGITHPSKFAQSEYFCVNDGACRAEYRRTGMCYKCKKYVGVENLGKEYGTCDGCRKSCGDVIVQSRPQGRSPKNLRDRYIDDDFASRLSGGVYYEEEERFEDKYLFASDIYQVREDCVFTKFRPLILRNISILQSRLADIMKNNNGATQ